MVSFQQLCFISTLQTFLVLNERPSSIHFHDDDLCTVLPPRAAGARTSARAICRDRPRSALLLRRSKGGMWNAHAAAIEATSIRPPPSPQFSTASNLSSSSSSNKNPLSWNAAYTRVREWDGPCLFAALRQKQLRPPPG